MSRSDERRERRLGKVSARKAVESSASEFEWTQLTIPHGAKMLKIDSPGIKRFDIIAYIAGAGNPQADKGSLHFERTFWVHRNVGPSENTYVCPLKTANKPCPICEHAQKLKRDPDADEDTIEALKPKQRQLFNIIDDDDRDAGIQILEYSYHMFGKLLYARVRDADEDDKYEFFADPLDGWLLKVGFAEQKFGTFKYYEAETIDFKARKEPYDESIVEKAYNLDDMVKILPYEKLEAIFKGSAADDDKPKDKDKEDPPKQERRRDPDEDKPAPKKEEKKDEPGLKKEESASNPAKDAGITVGCKVRHMDHGDCEVIHISGDGTSLKIEDSSGDVHKAIGIDEVRLIKPKPKEESTKEEPKKDPPKQEKKEDPPPTPKKAADDSDRWDDWDDAK